MTELDHTREPSLEVLALYWCHHCGHQWTMSDVTAAEAPRVCPRCRCPSRAAPVQHNGDRVLAHLPCRHCAVWWTQPVVEIVNGLEVSYTAPDLADEALGVLYQSPTTLVRGATTARALRARLACPVCGSDQADHP